MSESRVTVNKSDNGPVPAELKRLLLDYTTSFLLEKPPDLLDHAYIYFSRLREKHRLGTMIIRDYDQPEDETQDGTENLPKPEEETLPRSPMERRKSVCAERYEPERDDNPLPVHPKTAEQSEEIMEFFKNVLVFGGLDPVDAQVVIDAMFDRTVTAGEVIIRQGDDGDNFYIIRSGTFEVTITDSLGHTNVVHKYHGKGSFGELALLYNQPRSATVTAETDGSLWALDRTTFRRIVLKSAFNKRRLYESFIDNVPILRPLEPRERLDVADALVTKLYEDGQRIITQGDIADGMYFVEQGSVKITMLDRQKGEVLLKYLSVGDYFGELALLTHRPRAASATAEGTTKLAFLHVEAFERLLGPCMNILKRNAQLYESQLRNIFGSSTNIPDLR